MTERIVTLDNGLTVAVDPMLSTRSVSIGAWVGVGARDEPAEASGVSHFLEHLLFKGTPRRSAHDIAVAVDRVGGDINAFTSKEYTAYYCRMPARDVHDGVELVADVLSDPVLDPLDLENERHVILEELAMDDDSPDDVAHRRFAGRVFGDHPLGRDTAGERDTVSAIDVDAVRAFHSEHYRCENTVVAVAGAIDPDEAVAMVAEAFSGYALGDGSVDREAPGDRLGDEHVDDDTEQVHLLVGGRALPRDDPDREALDLANHVLGGGLSSRLFEEIRERRGLAYSVFSSTATYADAGAWSIYLGTLPEHVDEALEVISEELERFVRDGIDDHELAVALGSLTGAFEMGLEDSGARMARLGGLLSTTGRWWSAEEQIDRWRSVELDDVAKVIRRVYGDGSPLTVSVGPRSAVAREPQ